MVNAVGSVECKILSRLFNSSISLHTWGAVLLERLLQPQQLLGERHLLCQVDRHCPLPLASS